MTQRTESFEILRVLTHHRVQFIVVGMTAAVLQGAPVHTFDLDIVYALDDVLGLERLISAKEKAGRPKDHAALPVLRATLDLVKAKKSRSI